MRRTASLRTCLLVLAAVATSGVPHSAVAQDALGRTPHLAGAWIGTPWTLYNEVPHRFRSTDGGLVTTVTFRHALSMPGRTLLGVHWAVQSPTVPGRSDEVQPFVRYRAIEEAGGLADVAITGAWNSAARSVDGELEAARRVGPLRVMGVARWLASVPDSDGSRALLGAGAAFHPAPGRLGLALAGDIAVPLDGADVIWGAGLQAGIPHTSLSVSLHATNTAAATLQGASQSVGRRIGVELSFTVPVGYVIGRYPERSVAQEAVSEAPDAPADAVVEIRNYTFVAPRIVVPAGSVVEWVNRDDMVHTADAEDGAWRSGAIQSGAAWRARFSRRGIYPYYCGPHPYMKGVVIVE